MTELIKEIGPKQFLKSRTTGLFIGSVIGLIWMLYGMFLAKMPLNIIILSVSLISFITLILKIRKIRKNCIHQDEPNQTEKANNRRKKFYFLINFIIEILLLNICYDYLIKYHLTSILLFSISIIVGLHFIPMAVFLKIKPFFLCAGIMIISGVVLILISRNEKNVTLEIVQAIISGLALWLTVALSMKEIFESNLYTAKQ